MTVFCFALLLAFQTQTQPQQPIEWRALTQQPFAGLKPLARQLPQLSDQIEAVKTTADWQRARASIEKPIQKDLNRSGPPSK